MDWGLFCCFLQVFEMALNFDRSFEMMIFRLRLADAIIMKYPISVGFDTDTRHMQVYAGGLVILWSWQTYLLSTMDSFWQNDTTK